MRTVLREYVEQGGLGVKRGRGFYDEPGSADGERPPGCWGTDLLAAAGR